MTELAPLTMTLQLLGGLALFLYGMEKMTDGLNAAAGQQMNTLLAKLTGNRLLGALTGAIVTAVIQSSSVTTVLVVGFVSAGLRQPLQFRPSALGDSLAIGRPLREPYWCE